MVNAVADRFILNHGQGLFHIDDLTCRFTVPVKALQLGVKFIALALVSSSHAAEGVRSRHLKFLKVQNFKVLDGRQTFRILDLVALEF